MSGHREDGLVAWLRRRLPAGDDRPGDDAAILGRGSAERAWTVDQQVAGVHVPEDLDEAVWARRLLAVNLSDLAAMGAVPEAALLTLAIPADFDRRRFLDAMVLACERQQIALAGGDMATAPTAVTSLVLSGRRQARGRWVRRRGAIPGDTLWVGGTLGASALGQACVARGARLAGNRVALPTELEADGSLARAAKRAVRRHLAPEPQLDLGAWLAMRRRCAVIDVSDGLAIDLARLTRESGVGAVVQIDRLPLDRSLAPLERRLGIEPIDVALGGGEDYVLLFALPPTVRVPDRFDATAIGFTQPGDRLEVIDGDGRHPLPISGWDHFADVSDP